MEPEGRLLEEIKLEDGLTVYFYDQSRPIVGDRCQVQLLIHVPLEIKQAYFEKCTDPVSTYDSCIAAFGKELAFQRQKVRNFIGNKDADAVLQKMKTEFLESSLAYLSNPHFAGRCVMKRYTEWKKEEEYKKAYSDHCR